MRGHVKSHLVAPATCHHPRKRVIQYAKGLQIELIGRGVLDTPLSRGMTTVPERQRRKQIKEQKYEATIAVEALDPGVPYESRWAPYARIHGPGQGQFPKGSIRPRGYMASDARRSLAEPM